MKSLALAALTLVATSSVSLAQLRIAVTSPSGGPLAMHDPTTGVVIDSAFIPNLTGNPYTLTGARQLIQVRERLWTLGAASIHRFDLAGSYRDSIPPWISGPAACINVGCFANDKIYGICDSSSDVQMLSVNGQYLGSFSTIPHLTSPKSIVEFGGELLISGWPRKIGRFAYDGTFLGDFHVASGANDFGQARQLAVTDANTILVASDNFPYGVFEFDATGAMHQSLLFVLPVTACAPLTGGDLLVVNSFGLQRVDLAAGTAVTLQPTSAANMFTRLSRTFLVPPVESYCTAGTASFGTSSCVARTSALGWPSATASSGFNVFATDLPGQKTSVFFYGVTGRAATPWAFGSTSVVCVAAPHQRMGTFNSNGNGGFCDGMIWMDWLAFVAGSATVLGEPLSPGTVVNVQAWYRDPPSPKASNLSNALEFTLAP